LGRKNGTKKKRKASSVPKISTLRNTIGLGDSEVLLQETPSESVDLVFTSPPYYNARPEYSEYLTYEEYLLKIRKIIHQSHRVLNEGRFFVMNISPVLIRRASRNEASKRIAVPFDFHRLFIEEGFEFIDDIHWVKPEGAGWATGRGRRFAADRNPLQYKPVPVTEYIMVYRKKTDKLIDWLIRKHPDQDLVAESKIKDGYETTNLWKIHPSYNKKHPAVFPLELAEKVIQYYSFKNDVILDPFGGTGTTGKAAVKNGRRFVLFEQDEEYMKLIKNDVFNWLQKEANKINWINTDAPTNDAPFLNLK
jgi:DNA modification methylase